MDARTLSICIGAVALAVGGAVYGVKFCKIKNYLIGIEWFVLAISSTNFMIYVLTHSSITYAGVVFLDTFSRAFGIPVVTVAGLMILTHGYRPSVRADILFFVFSCIGTLIILADPFAKFLPYFLLLMWSLFSIYLLYFAYKLFKEGETLPAFGMVLVALTNQAIATIYDFYTIPGDETNIVFNFFTIALFVWTFLTVQTWYSYCAFQRSINTNDKATIVSGPQP